MAAAAPSERSSSRPAMKGPRSLTQTTTERPVPGLDTRSTVPNGYSLEAAVNPIVASFALGLALLCSLMFGLAPAARAAKSDMHGVLKEGGRSAGMGGIRDRLRTGLIGAELAVALLLLAEVLIASRA